MKDFQLSTFIRELIGTFVLVFIGAGSAAVISQEPIMLVTSWVIIPFVFALIVVGLVAVHGGQYNPAVSIAFAIRKRISWFTFVFNVIAQLIGGIIAALLIWLVIDSKAVGANDIAGLEAIHGAGFKASMLGVLVEAVITFMFVFIILRITKKPENGKIAPFVIGLSLFTFITVAFFLTGGSLNPARSFGPALIAGGTALEQVWIYFAGPLLGGALAAVVDMFAKE